VWFNTVPLGIFGQVDVEDEVQGMWPFWLAAGFCPSAGRLISFYILISSSQLLFLNKLLRYKRNPQTCGSKSRSSSFSRPEMLYSLGNTPVFQFVFYAGITTFLWWLLKASDPISNSNWNFV
jgi:hypothetical protein